MRLKPAASGRPREEAMNTYGGSTALSPTASSKEKIESCKQPPSS